MKEEFLANFTNYILASVPIVRILPENGLSIEKAVFSQGDGLI
jgi:hypothetical protein